MTNFDKALQIVTGMEGGYSNHKSDPGGKTRFGITEAVAREFGYEGSMEDLPKELQKNIARAKYWQNIGGNEIAALSHPLAVEMFEIGFNVGPAKAVRWLQSWLNALNRNEKDWPNIIEDGIWGPQTKSALESYLARRDEEELVRAVNAEQIMYYKRLAQDRPDTYSHFLNGWLRHRGKPYLD